MSINGNYFEFIWGSFQRKYPNKKITNCRGFKIKEIQIKGENRVDEIAKQIESFNTQLCTLFT